MIGSGPAGLAVADELNRCGHTVTVFERDEGPGGLMRFGVPDAKLEKQIIDRRVAILAGEGIEFVYNTDVGGAVSVRGDQGPARRAGGRDRLARTPRPRRAGPQPQRNPLRDGLPVPAQPVGGCIEGRPSRAPEPGTEISAAGKRVIVVGGGDTGMDCISNSHREGAAGVVMLDVYAALPESGRDASHPWPLPPKRTLSTYALDEGGKRRWGTEVTGFGGRDGRVSHVYARKVTGTSSRDLTPVPGSEFVLEADLVLIAIGFEEPEHAGPIEQLDLELDQRGNIRTEQTYRSSTKGVYACGDARIGQSLIVTAIAEGRKCARIVNQRSRRQPDGRRPGDAGDRRLERRGRPNAAPRGRGGRNGQGGRGVLHRPGGPGALSAGGFAPVSGRLKNRSESTFETNARPAPRFASACGGNASVGTRFAWWSGLRSKIKV